jgi:SAM-dependent methyltransferase
VIRQINSLRRRFYDFRVEVYRSTTSLHDRTCDWWFRIETRDYTARSGDANAGMPTPYRILFRARRLLRLGSGDVVYDLGCGRGRAARVFSDTGAAVIGVDIDPVGVALATRHAPKATIRLGDVRDQSYADATVLWLFNPFGADTVRAVVAKAKRPRLRIGYYPIHHAVLLDEGFRERARVGGRINKPLVVYESPGFD